MKDFQFIMPVKLLYGEIDNRELLGYGKRALIVTGKSSQKNGALDDMTTALVQAGLSYEIFDSVEENPSVENVQAAATAGKGCDFVIGIGGGSPLDAAKAVAVILANPGIGEAALYGAQLSHVPMLAVPTTAGTGSETTPYAILTLHGKETKASMTQRVFPDKAFLNGKYMMGMSEKTTMSTAIDAFTHLAEGYLSSSSNFLSDVLAESGLRAFGACVPQLTKRQFDLDVRDKLLVISALAGMVITQTKTSLPHHLGYCLTYYKNVPHGFANGVLMNAYFDFYENQDKVNRIVQLLGFESREALRVFLDDAVEVDAVVSAEEIEAYADKCCESKDKLKTHPFDVTRNDILEIYRKSLTSQ